MESEVVGYGAFMSQGIDQDLELEDQIEHRRLGSWNRAITLET